MKAGRFYTFSIDETPSGCLTYVDVFTSDFKQLFRLDASSKYVFYAKQNYASIAIIMRADGSIQDGEAHFNVYENQFIRSDYFADVLKIDGVIGNVYQETQTSASENHFERVLDGKKGYVRIVTSGSFGKATLRPDGTPLNQYFQRIDTTAATTATFVYVETPVGSIVNLEFIDEAILSNAIFDNVNNIKKTIDIGFRGAPAMIPVVVKKDGSGDFTTIQDAINSIDDASVIKQYDIQVYDDFEITDLTNLWMLDYPNTHVSANPGQQCALVITKDYVNVRGMGRQRKLSVISPANTAVSSFPNIQVIIPRGNCKISNFDVILQGGRYAIHQENFGPLDLNRNATTILENINAVHLGNSSYSGGTSAWGATLAQANGAASGCRWIYKNCSWHAKEQGAPMYMHLNKNFSEPANIELIDCTFIPHVSLTLAQSLNQCYINDRGSNMGARVSLVGNGFTGFNAFSFARIDDTEQTRGTDDICEGEINFVGHSNIKQVVNIRENPSLSFKTINNNVEIDVVGGTAYDVLWGATYAKFGGTSPSSNVKGICVGRRKIFDQASASKSSIFSLAYRLGNCENNAKTLIVNVGGTDYTITFNQNYMTADGSSYNYNTTPRYTNAEILAQINALYPEVFEAMVGGWKEMQTPNDCKMAGVVFPNYNIEFGTIVSFIEDYGGGYNKISPSTIPADNNRILMGVACRSTNKRDNCMVALADKNYFPMSLLYPETAPAKTLFKVTSGKLEITTNASEAVFYAIDSATIGLYREPVCI